MSPSPDEVRLRDPLSDVTRKERRSLLGVSMLGIAIAQAGLVPTEIASLGVKLTEANQSTVLVLLGCVCLYYLAAFVAYAATDYVAWKTALRDAIVEAWTQPREVEKEKSEQEVYREIERSQRLETYLQTKNATTIIAELLVLPASRVRATLEFILPVVVGFFACSVLFLRGAA